MAMVGDLRKYTPLLVVVAAVLLVLLAMRGTGSGDSPFSDSPNETAAKTPATKSSTQPVKAEAPKMRTVPGKTYSAPPAMAIDINRHYIATFDTSKGKIVCELFPKDAPATVNNFVFLAKAGYFDGTVFHRVIKDFMIQGGDPTGTGAGGPGYFFNDEDSIQKFKTGTLAMANSGPGTNGSQFFITHKPTPWLQGKHTIFGEVQQGQDVVNAIARGDTLNKVTIQEN
jgi:peptidyl-prolyl cis-trans isomerase B (cyclophilin B)